MQKKLIRIISLAFCALILVSGLALYFFKPPAGGTQAVKSSGQALIGGPFDLVDHNGNTVSETTYSGKLMLVFFGFTHCPDICPAELQVVSAALHELGDKAADIQPLFITIDPERDTQENLAAYMKHFHKQILGLHGSKTQIDKAARAYRVYYKKIENKDFPGDYTMDHTSLIYVMGRKGQYLTHFPYGTSPEKMASSLKKYL